MPDQKIALHPKLVNQTFKDCLAPPRKRGIERITVKVGKTTAILDKAKLVENISTVLLMLDELPTEFLPKKRGGGGGWTIRNACKTKEGVQWTTLMVEVERLVALGMGQGWVMVLTPTGFPLTNGDQYLRIDPPTIREA